MDSEKPKSNAQRQREYRERNLYNPDSDKSKINSVVSIHTVAQLRRLARHAKTSQCSVLEELISQAEREILNKMDSSEQEIYYDD